jgi:hypothetical protein
MWQVAKVSRNLQLATCNQNAKCQLVSFRSITHRFNYCLIVTFSQATVQLSKQVNNPRQCNADAGQQQPGEC